MHFENSMPLVGGWIDSGLRILATRLLNIAYDACYFIYSSFGLVFTIP
jgi:hypothetical protein